ncbi:hypothetical protein BGX31_002256, partial [Mortierella sp. GBA43]
MQTRRQRLVVRQQLQRSNPLDASDLSLDEADVLDDDDDHEPTPDPEQYRQHLWELEQRLCQRSESATKTRSHFLMERRVSAGERAAHAQRVAQRQRTEQQQRRDRVRDELEQKMLQAMARRNAYLEAAIENDPSRRFRRRSSIKNTTETADADIGKRYHRDCTRVSGISAASAQSLLPPPPPPHPTTTTMMHPSPQIIHGSPPRTPSISRNVVMKNLNDAHRQHRPQPEQRQHRERGPVTKNRAVSMTHTTSTSEHLTNMTSEKGTATPMDISPSITVTANTSPDIGGRSPTHQVVTGPPLTNTSMDMDVDVHTTTTNTNTTNTAPEAPSGATQAEGLEGMTLWAQRRIRQQMVQKAARDYTKAIGSHERLLAMRFEELARLLHTNKNLIQATLKLLKYSSQLVHMDTPASMQRPRQVFKNPARVFLSMYMVLAHPNQIRSPAEPAPANAPSDHSDNDPAFDSLVESSKALLEALQDWIMANLQSSQDQDQDEIQNHPSPSSSTTLSAPSSPTSSSFPFSSSTTDLALPITTTTETTLSKEQRQQQESALVSQFDQAWITYYQFFEAWKNGDAQRLLKTLLDHAQQIDTLWRSVQNEDPAVRLEWEPRIEGMRRDLRAKATKLAGDQGAARLDEVFAGFVSATTAADPAPAPAPAGEAEVTPAAMPTLPPTTTTTEAPEAEEAAVPSTSTDLPPTEEGVPSTEDKAAIAPPSPPKKRQRAPKKTTVEDAALIDLEETTMKRRPRKPKPAPEEDPSTAPEAPADQTEKPKRVRTRKPKAAPSTDQDPTAKAEPAAESASEPASKKSVSKKKKSKGIKTPRPATISRPVRMPVEKPPPPIVMVDPKPEPPRVPTEDDILDPLGVPLDKPTRWSNWKMIHELALDGELRIGGNGSLTDGLSSSSDSDSDEDGAANGSSKPQTMEDLIRTIARKAYFDKIREETDQGHLDKWIGPLLTSIRERLLEMVKVGTPSHLQISEALDLEFVQQQVDKGVFDIKAALAGVLAMMARLCAPVRDAKIKQIQEDLEAITQNPFVLSSSSSSSSPSPSSSNNGGG